MPFFGTVVISPVDESKGRTLWRVEETFAYLSKRYGVLIKVPVGFITDLASVPRTVLAWWLLGGTANSAAVIHDWIYHHRINGKMIPRKACDNILVEVAKETGVPAWRCKLLYWGVRLGGWTAYGEGKR